MLQISFLALRTVTISHEDMKCMVWKSNKISLVRKVEYVFYSLQLGNYFPLCPTFCPKITAKSLTECWQRIKYRENKQRFLRLESMADWIHNTKAIPALSKLSSHWRTAVCTREKQSFFANKKVSYSEHLSNLEVKTHSVYSKRGMVKKAGQNRTKHNSVDGK